MLKYIFSLGIWAIAQHTTVIYSNPCQVNKVPCAGAVPPENLCIDESSVCDGTQDCQCPLPIRNTSQCQDFTDETFRCVGLKWHQFVDQDINNDLQLQYLFQESFATGTNYLTHDACKKRCIIHYNTVSPTKKRCVSYIHKVKGKFVECKFYSFTLTKNQTVEMIGATISVSVDRNECEMADVCDELGPHSVCVNSHGSFHCACPHGFEITNTRNMDKGKCVDVDECQSERSEYCPSLLSGCINTIGSYSCHCYNASNKVLDPCQYGLANDCDVEERAYCTRTAPQKYTCQCRTGYSGDGYFCSDYNECHNIQYTDHCRTQGGTCQNIPGSFRCDCTSDTGLITSVDGNCYDLDECIHNISNCDLRTTNCKNLFGSYECVCLNKNLSIANATVQNRSIFTCGHIQYSGTGLSLVSPDSYSSYYIIPILVMVVLVIAALATFIAMWHRTQSVALKNDQKRLSPDIYPISANNLVLAQKSTEEDVVILNEVDDSTYLAYDPADHKYYHYHHLGDDCYYASLCGGNDAQNVSNVPEKGADIDRESYISSVTQNNINPPTYGDEGSGSDFQEWSGNNSKNKAGTDKKSSKMDTLRSTLSVSKLSDVDERDISTVPISAHHRSELKSKLKYVDWLQKRESLMHARMSYDQSNVPRSKESVLTKGNEFAEFYDINGEVLTKGNDIAEFYDINGEPLTTEDLVDILSTYGYEIHWHGEDNESFAQYHNAREHKKECDSKDYKSKRMSNTSKPSLKEQPVGHSSEISQNTIQVNNNEITQRLNIPVPTQKRNSIISFFQNAFKGKSTDEIIDSTDNNTNMSESQRMSQMSKTNLESEQANMTISDIDGSIQSASFIINNPSHDYHLPVMALDETVPNILFQQVPTRKGSILSPIPSQNNKSGRGKAKNRKLEKKLRKRKPPPSNKSTKTDRKRSKITKSNKQAIAARKIKTKLPTTPTKVSRMENYAIKNPRMRF